MRRAIIQICATACLSLAPPPSWAGTLTVEHTFAELAGDSSATIPIITSGSGLIIVEANWLSTHKLLGQPAPVSVTLGVLNSSATPLATSSATSSGSTRLQYTVSAADSPNWLVLVSYDSRELTGTVRITYPKETTASAAGGSGSSGGMGGQPGGVADAAGGILGGIGATGGSIGSHVGAGDVPTNGGLLSEPTSRKIKVPAAGKVIVDIAWTPPKAQDQFGVPLVPPGVGIVLMRPSGQMAASQPAVNTGSNHLEYQVSAPGNPEDQWTALAVTDGRYIIVPTMTASFVPNAPGAAPAPSTDSSGNANAPPAGSGPPDASGCESGGLGGSFGAGGSMACQAIGSVAGIGGNKPVGDYVQQTVKSAGAATFRVPGPGKVVVDVSWTPPAIKEVFGVATVREGVGIVLLRPGGGIGSGSMEDTRAGAIVTSHAATTNGANHFEYVFAAVDAAPGDWTALAVTDGPIQIAARVTAAFVAESAISPLRGAESKVVSSGGSGFDANGNPVHGAGQSAKGAALGAARVPPVPVDTGHASCDGGCFDASASGGEHSATLGGHATVEIDDGEYFRLVLRSAGDEGHYVAFGRQPGGPPRAGTAYALSNTCDEDNAANRPDDFSAEYVVNDYRDGEAEQYQARSGTLTIDSIGPTWLRGHFAFDGCRYTAEGEIKQARVRGTFEGLWLSVH